MKQNRRNPHLRSEQAKKSLLKKIRSPVLQPMLPMLAQQVSVLLGRVPLLLRALPLRPHHHAAAAVGPPRNRVAAAAVLAAALPALPALPARPIHPAAEDDRTNFTIGPFSLSGSCSFSGRSFPHIPQRNHSLRKSLPKFRTSLARHFAIPFFSSHSMSLLPDPVRTSRFVLACKRRISLLGPAAPCFQWLVDLFGGSSLHPRNDSYPRKSPATLVLRTFPPLERSLLQSSPIHLLRSFQTGSART